MNDILTTFADFHFLRPMLLWAILPLLIIGGLLAYIHKQQSGWQSVLAGHLYKHIISQSNAKKLRQPFWLLTLGWLIATLALAGPTWERLPQPVFQLHTGKVVLMDMTMSMRATDVKPNRLSRARYKAIDLVKQISEGETGLVAYAGDAFTISPLSSDGQNLTALIPSLSPEIMPIAGSEPALGLKAAIELLQKANYPQGEIFWITDGIDNRQMKEMSDLLNSSPYRLSILAVGTEEGAPIQMPNGELLKDNNGSIVLPKLNPSNLKTLARQGGGRYAPMQADNSDIEYLVDQSTLGNEEQKTDDKDAANDNFGDKWQEMGPYLLLLLLPFAAYSFRRGLLGIVLLGLLLPIYTPEASAGLWQDMWQTNNQQALKAYNKQQFDEAAQKFDDPLWQGSALYKNQDYENALKAFNQVNSAEGLYNQANTLAQLGKLPEAIKKYDEALAQQPDNEDAKANKALIEKLLEQQKSDQDQQKNDQQQNDDQQQDGDKQQQDQDQQGDDSEQQNSEQQQQQDQQQSDSQEDNSEQQDQNQQNENNEQQKSEEEQQKQESQERESQTDESDPKEGEQEQQAQQMQQQELSDEEKEQMQRMQNLLNRVPDDPAFLLKRKMQIEAQQRKRETPPGNLQRNW